LRVISATTGARASGFEEQSVYARRFAGGVEILAPAKLNLFLEVLERRDDGFHEIESLMVPISLFDTLSFREAPAGQLELRCQWACGLRKQDRPEGLTRSPVEWEKLPEGYDNVAMRAVDLLRRRAGIAAGASLQLTKRIPSAAGLGGGSSDAAAALVAANLVWNLGWPADRLSQLAGEVGSDVPFFLGAGPALCQGRGERIRPLPSLGSLSFVIVCPPEGLSTAAVYKNCRAAEVPRTADGLIEALRKGDHRRLASGVFNRLEEPAARLSPWIERLENEISRLDCVAARMSGSGTSYFGICRHARHARRVTRLLRGRGFNRVYAVRSL
jgi:4-diphosphocytidyl-2-C-methyl-D-erythritol kinase